MRGGHRLDTVIDAAAINLILKIPTARVAAMLGKSEQDIVDQLNEMKYCACINGTVSLAQFLLLAKAHGYSRAEALNRFQGYLNEGIADYLDGIDWGCLSKWDLEIKRALTKKPISHTVFGSNPLKPLSVDRIEAKDLLGITGPRLDRIVQGYSKSYDGGPLTFQQFVWLVGYVKRKQSGKVIGQFLKDRLSMERLRAGSVDDLSDFIKEFTTVSRRLEAINRM